MAALAGPWYTVEGYSPVTNVISQLGAQNTPNNSVMNVGLLALGVGVVADGIRRFSKPALPFIAFGLFMALAGLLAHKPLTPAVAFSEPVHQAHLALAALAGVSVTVGFLWNAVAVSAVRTRVVATTLAAICLILPLCMLAFQDVQGLIQRIMYLLVFVWLWIYYPLTTMAGKAMEVAPDGEPHG